MRLVILLAAIIGFPFCPLAQRPIPWNNPSFEDEPAHSHPPRGWYYCDEVGESPPDIHPGGFFEVTQEPYDGRTYLGMVARDIGTTEGVGQRLLNLMVPGQCYVLQCYAARSVTYKSVSRGTGQLAMFDRPVRLQLWAGTHNCDKAKLLAQSPAVESPNWQKYRLNFQVEQPYTHIFLEAAHLSSAAVPYNGNVLVDQLSPLLPVDCEEGQVVAETESVDGVRVSSIDTLEERLSRLLAQVIITADGRVEEAVVQSKEDYFQVNPFLWRVGQMLRQFPGRKLELGVTGNYSKLAIAQIQRELWYSLQASGLPEAQFRIKKRIRGNAWQGKGALRYNLK